MAKEKTKTKTKTDGLITSGWKPRYMRFGRWVLRVTRAISGEWAVEGRVKRVGLVRNARLKGVSFILGPWCFQANKAA